MGEAHSKGEQRHRPLALAVTDSRSTLTRAGDARPFKPYVYRGGDREPPAVTAARERHQALNAGIGSAQRQRERSEAARAAAEVMPYPAPSYERYRELREDDEQAALDAERDRYQAAMAAVPEPRKPDPAPAPALVAAASRCRRCGYLTASAGHKVMCDE